MRSGQQSEKQPTPSSHALTSSSADTATHGFRENIGSNRLTQQGRSAPQNRSLPVKVAGEALAVQIVLQIILLSGAFTDVADIAIRFQVTD